MKQATKLACAIIHDPDLLIADEPSNGLDAKAREFMISTLNTMVNDGNRSVLMASHLMDDVEQVCENILLLHKGKLAAQGKIEDLKAIDKEIEIHVWGGATPLEQRLKDQGFRVRREGRVMRIAHTEEDTTTAILRAAAEVGAGSSDARIQLRSRTCSCGASWTTSATASNQAMISFVLRLKHDALMHPNPLVVAHHDRGEFLCRGSSHGPGSNGCGLGCQHRR